MTLSARLMITAINDIQKVVILIVELVYVNLKYIYDNRTNTVLHGIESISHLFVVEYLLFVFGNWKTSNKHPYLRHFAWIYQIGHYIKKTKTSSRKTNIRQLINEYRIAKKKEQTIRSS